MRDSPLMPRPAPKVSSTACLESHRTGLHSGMTRRIRAVLTTTWRRCYGLQAVQPESRRSAVQVRE